MNIKNIKKLSSGKYQISFTNNEKLITYDEVLLKYNILYKKELSDKEIKELQGLNTYYDVYNNTIKYIAKKMRSIKEIKEYLNKYELSLKEKNKIIETLKNNKLLNDENYVKAYIYDRLYLSNDGPYKIKRDLLNNDIDESLIDNELSKIDREELINKLTKLINKKVNNSKASKYLTKQKVYVDMQNLGYSKELIDSCYVDDRNDISYLEKDYFKIFNDLSRKETDSYKLNLKIKQKLYQKGYNLSDIENIINKKS